MTSKRDFQVFRDLTLEQVEAAICEREPSHYQDHRDWAQDCHSVSLSIVKSDLFEQARVARGACKDVFGQHSWVVLGNDCYDPRAKILDCTLWSYDASQPVVWKGTMKDGLHTPHGALRDTRGKTVTIFEQGCPQSGGGDEVPLNWPTPPSPLAQTWMDMFRKTAEGPLDRKFWGNLASNWTVLGWPAGEFFAAMDNTHDLRALVPIDRLGMLTDLNPCGLYLKEGARDVPAEGRLR